MSQLRVFARAFEKIYENRDAYLKIRVREEYGPNYDDESDECNNAQTWGKEETNGNYK